VEVERVVADTPGDCAFFRCGRSLVSLAVDAKVHDVVAANGAVVDDDVPRPEGDRIPLFHLKPLLVAQSSTAPTGLRGLWLRCTRRRIGHFDVRHLSVCDKGYLGYPLRLSRDSKYSGR